MRPVVRHAQRENCVLVPNSSYWYVALRSAPRRWGSRRLVDQYRSRLRYDECSSCQMIIQHQFCGARWSGADQGRQMNDITPICDEITKRPRKYRINDGTACEEELATWDRSRGCPRYLASPSRCIPETRRHTRLDGSDRFLQRLEPIVEGVYRIDSTIPPALNIAHCEAVQYRTTGAAVREQCTSLSRFLLQIGSFTHTTADAVCFLV